MAKSRALPFLGGGVVSLVLVTCSSVADVENPQDDPDPTPPTRTESFETVTRITPGTIRRGDYLGFSLDATSEFTVMSAPRDATLGSRVGAVYVLRRDGLNFDSNSFKILPDRATDEDQFGYAVAISGNTLVVGAPFSDVHGEDSGAAYVYRNTGANQWALAAELTPDTPASGDQFGWSVAINGGIVAVGSAFDAENYSDDGPIKNANGVAQGSVFLFEEARGWALTDKLVPTNQRGHRWDAFGRSVAIDGSQIAVGAPGTDNTSYDGPGSVYVFERLGGAFVQTARLEASAAADEDSFGRTLDMEGSLLAVTAPGNVNSLLPGQASVPGAAYLFRSGGAGWVEDARLVSTIATDDDGFAGGDIALHDRFVIVGAPRAAVATRFNGAAHLFDGSAGWVESHRITAPDPLNEDLFGSALAATSDLLFVGSHRRCNSDGCQAGATYFVQ